MKNIFTILVIVTLSCRDKIVSNEINTVQVAKVETIAEPAVDAIKENRSSEINPKSEIQNTPYIRSSLFKGTLNNNIKISLYLIEQESSCGGDVTYFTAMYKYDNQDNWILLDVSTDRLKKNYCMVEDNFTGTLFLEKTKNKFSGYWISPDVIKQFKVELENQLLDIKFAKDYEVVEELDEILFDDLLYSKNDC